MRMTSACFICVLTVVFWLLFCFYVLFGMIRLITVGTHTLALWSVKYKDSEKKAWLILGGYACQAMTDKFRYAWFSHNLSTNCWWRTNQKLCCAFTVSFAAMQRILGCFCHFFCYVCCFFLFFSPPPPLPAPTPQFSCWLHCLWLCILLYV